MIEAAERALSTLMEGNARFRAGEPLHTHYEPADLISLAEFQARPIAAVVSCSDSRVAPEIIFDQPLGNLFVSRLPGNVVADSSRWMSEIAMEAFQIPLLMVIGHTRCLAVGQVVQNQLDGTGGAARYEIHEAVSRARLRKPEDIMQAAIEENARMAAEKLARDVIHVRRCVEAGLTSVVAAVYDVHTGQVHVL